MRLRGGDKGTLARVVWHRVTPPGWNDLTGNENKNQSRTSSGICAPSVSTLERVGEGFKGVITFFFSPF